MTIGYVCPCCGQKMTREELAMGEEAPELFLCQPCGSTPNEAAPDMSVHTIPLDTPVVLLEATQAFELLSEEEKAYAYHIGKASWEGAKICLLQCSIESVPIFCLLQAAYSAQPTIKELIEAAKEKGLTKEEIQQALMYSAAFYGNLGNYKSFGDTKFVPTLPPERFWAFLSCSSHPQEELQQLWDECYEIMYSLTARERQMGLGASKGVTTYYSANCDESDAAVANSFLDSVGLSAYNTRLFKKSDGQYIVRIASASTENPCSELVSGSTTTHTYQGKTFIIERGDYAALMSRVVESLENAIPFAANETQKNMIQEYCTSFSTGSHDAHKNGSRYWIQDKGPAVESYIGFIESYRDPSGVRGEWEGFVACVNKEVSAKFQILVDQAESFLTKMPWPACLEKDKFLRPDFTSLEVLAFGSSGVPAGINIPNYDDIRQSEGFKNVSLGNVLQASYGVAADKPVTFVSAHDQELYKALKGPAFEVQVGIHELLGHGSGKLYHQNTSDAENLIASNFIHPVTGEPVKGPFYGPGATWNSTFGKLSPTYEECRAECCGIYLSLEPAVLKVFGHDSAATSGDGGIADVTYVNWLLMVRAGLTGLEFYTPSTNEWRQAHMQARYVILRLLLEASQDDGDKLLVLNEMVDSDGKPNVEIVLNRKLISTAGKEIIGDFLLKLQVYKSLGDVENGSKMYNKYSEVTPDMLRLRETIMARKEPRKLLIQPHMCKNNDKIELKTFPSTPEGMIESFVSRFPSQDLELLALYRADKEFAK